MTRYSSSLYGELITPVGNAGVSISLQPCENKEAIRIRINNNQAPQWFELLCSRDDLRALLNQADFTAGKGKESQ